MKKTEEATTEVVKKPRKHASNTRNVGIKYIKSNKPKEITDIKEALSEAEIVEMCQSSAILNKEQERIMIERYRNNRDILNLYLFNHNVRAADNLAGRYFSKYQHTVKNCNYTLEDFVSSAKEGLWIAATRFDIDKNIKFITYATPWIFKFLIKHFYEQENMLRSISLNNVAYEDADEEVQDILNVNQIDPTSAEYDRAVNDDIMPEDTTAIDAVNRIESYKISRSNNDQDNTDYEISEDEAKEIMEKLKANYKKISDEIDKQVFLYVCKKTLTKMNKMIQERGGFKAEIRNDVENFIKKLPSSKKQLMTILKTDNEEAIGTACISIMKKYNFN